MQTEIPTTSATSRMINLKLLIDKSNKRVLYAEAGKEFVDFLFGFLELPVGAILKLLVERGMVRSWSIGKVYESVLNIDQSYFQTKQTKISLLNPKNTPSSNTKINPMLLQFGCIGQQQEDSSPRLGFSTEAFFSKPYGCTGQQQNCSPSLGRSTEGLFSNTFGCLGQQQYSSPGLLGRSTDRPFSNSALFNNAFGSSSFMGVSSVAPSIVTNQVKVIDGFVEGKVTYMVMDDLTVEAMSSISSITILNRFKVRDVGCLEDKTFQVDMEMALKLVKASFESTTVLTDVFLGSS